MREEEEEENTAAAGVDPSEGEPRMRSNIRAKRWSRLEWWEGLVNALCKVSEGINKYLGVGSPLKDISMFHLIFPDRVVVFLTCSQSHRAAQVVSWYFQL